MATHDITIIGGGISGLSLAHHCAEKGLSVVVLERNDYAGGSIHTHKNQDHFWIEQGSHTLRNSYGSLLKILDHYGLSNQIIAHKRFPIRMLSSRKMHSIALSLSWSEIGFSLPGACLLKKKKMNIKQYCIGLFGRGNFERVISPLLNAWFCQDADDFPTTTFLKRRIRQKNFPKKFTLPGGLQTLPEAILRHPKICFRANAQVDTVRYRDGFKIKDKDGIEYLSTYCAIATPCTTASKLLEGLDEKIATHLSTIPVKTVESVTLFAPAQDFQIPMSSGLVPLGNNFSETNQRFAFFSAVSRDGVLPTPSTLAHFRGYTFHFRPNVLDFESKIQSVCEVLHLSRDKVQTLSATHSLPALRMGHDTWTQTLDKLIETSPLKSHLLLTGNYFNGLTIEDCITRSEAEFRRVFLEQPETRAI